MAVCLVLSSDFGGLREVHPLAEVVKCQALPHRQDAAQGMTKVTSNVQIEDFLAALFADRLIGQGSLQLKSQQLVRFTSTSER